MAKKFREVRKALRTAGWTKVRQTGSHQTWESP
ncbi:MAG: type II toxin-antitoxin system HicA family toxin, partial [Thermoleophilaceae bacterium]